jgi:hypothetical protein
LTPELPQQIFGSYSQDNTPFPLDPGPAVAQTIFEARRTSEGYEIQPFCIMTRGKEDVEWKTVQEYGTIMPRQYVGEGMRLRLENPFERQAPQFIIRVLSGYTDGYVDPKPNASKEELSKDMRGYLIGAGAKVEPQAEALTTASQRSNAAPTLSLQPKAAQITNPGRHRFADVGPALEVGFDNRLNQWQLAEAGIEVVAPQSVAQNPTQAQVEHFQTEGFPSFGFRGDAQNARGVALSVTGDGSCALLMIQVGPQKDYVVPIDFTGRKDIFIPLGEVARTTGRWGMRYHSRGAGYGAFNSVSIGFARVPVKTDAKVLVENLRMVGEKPSWIKNPVIHAGSGTMTVLGEIKTDQYLWYQGGDRVGLYDLNWHLLKNLPVRLNNYSVEKGLSDIWIEGESADPSPWFDLQFIAKGEAIPLKTPRNAGSDSSPR